MGSLELNHARVAAAGLALILAPACPADTLDQTGVPPILGYTQFKIYEGKSIESEFLLAWEVGFSLVVSNRGAGGSAEILSFDRDRMSARDGAPPCWFQANKLVADSGEVLFTAWGLSVYAGDQSGANEEALLYRFEGPRIIAGLDGRQLGTATLNLHLGEPAAKLMIAALFEGVCGGDGL